MGVTISSVGGSSAAGAAAGSAGGPMGALAGAGIGALGGIAQGLVSSAFNANEAYKNRQFQERMSNTSHQREVADLRAAGLNPILSSKYGGSSTPSGSSAQASSPDVAHSGAQGALIQAQIADINSARALKDAQTLDVNTMRFARLNELQSNAMMHGASTEQLRAQARLLGLEQSHSAMDLSRARREQDFHKGFGGKIAPYMRFNPLGNTGINFLRLRGPSVPRQTYGGLHTGGW